MSEMTDIERLIAIKEIEQLKARRDRAVDTKDWDTYLALHAPDHVSDHAEENGGRMEGAENMVKQVSQILGPDMISVHHSHTPDITFQSATEAKGVWAMEDMIFWKEEGRDRWIHGFGYYYENYEKRAGEWLFTYRRLERIHVLTSEDAPPMAITPPLSWR